ncbi:MAG: tRNA lysidine(34) synthetase TilS [Firmicutes bacterium]|nr:tRNA lysidine(34) synthetase TilS [Bacillota bacterium]
MNKVYEYLDKLLQENDTVVVATSGGPDSMALLDIICSYKKKFDLKIIVAHVNHNIREESDEEEKLVEKYTSYQHVIFESMKIKQVINNNFEMEARKIRYDFFEKLIKKYNAKYLFTAHHGDDLIETILMRLSRGSILKGYKGIPTETCKNNYKIIRPLLWLEKKDLINYVNEHNIKYAIDYTNNLDEHTRNRFRHNVLPFLKEETDKVHLKYKKFSDELNMYDEFIDKYINKSKILNNNMINIEEFNKEDILIKNKIIEKLLNDIYDGHLEIIHKNHVNNIIDLITSKKTNSKIDLPNDYIGINDYGFFKIVKKNYNKEIDIILDKDLEINCKQFKYVSSSDSKSNYILRLKSDEISMPLHIRTRKNGDRISVKNMNGTKKISDILTDEKIKYDDRCSILLVCDNDDQILWVPGIKKSKFDKDKTEKCDIILEYILKRGGKNE